ncbi:MAG: type II toxin-antitoxin system VapC family toxin [Patescibacteria group bacterium]
MNKTVIIDASVLLMEIIGKSEQIEKKLRHILHDTASAAYILPFTLAEFANGIRFSTRDIPVAKQALDRFTALALPVMPIVPGDMRAIVELSYRLNTTVYDTAYHYWALMHEGMFITCDKDYFKKASSLGHIELWE